MINRQKHIENCKRWRAKNVEYIREYKKRQHERNPLYFVEYMKRYRELHPDVDKIRDHEKHRLKDHRRRTRKLAAAGNYTVHEWRALRERFQNKCLRCWRPKPLTMDHVHALAVGGNNSILNIQPLCRSCNCSKGIKFQTYKADLMLPAPRLQTHAGEY